MMKERAVVFDFDGTLIDTGHDKGVHILYSAWVACFTRGFAGFLHPHHPGPDVERMLKAYTRYPGAPRFEQLSALVNALVNDRYVATKNPEGLELDRELTARYEEIRREYNMLFSGLNDTAAQTYWRPFPSVAEVLPRLAENFDLYVASGVVQEILDEDFDHHGFNRDLFLGVFGSDDKGARNKGVVLAEIKTNGYRDVLFVGDSTKDQEYAIQAGSRFYRIRGDADLDRLISTGPFALPDEKEPWSYSPAELQFFREKSVHLLRAYGSGEVLENEQVCRWINSP